MKIPEPRQLSSGNWYLYMRLGGEGIPVTERSRADCIKTAQVIKAEYLAGKRKPAGRNTTRTVGELIDDYIAKYTPVLSVSTVRGYDIIRRCRFAGLMDQKPADVRDWQKVINRELEAVSVKTVVNAWGLVSAALRDAMLPVPEVKLAPAEEKNLAFLEPEEIPPFLDAIRGDPCEVEILLELHGLRTSEAQQVVRKNQIDVRRGNILVHGAMVRGKDGLVEKRTNKTAAGTRTVPILIPRLAELAAEYAARKEPLPVHGPTMVLKHVHAAAARAGVTDVSNHDLRRTFASLCWSKNIPERVVMELGGWTDPDVMHKIYIKLSQRDRRGAVDALKAFYAPQTDADRLGEARKILADLRERFGDLPELREVLRAAEHLDDAHENAH